MKTLRALERGQGSAEDIEILLGLVDFLGPGKTFCAHAPGAVEPLGSAIKYFRAEFEAGVAPGSAPRSDAVQMAGA
ncbi:NADH-quinone oxidoreductase subunit F [compost metagenome]